ncbi:ABC transporter ATP-binding protein [Jiangella asiatica]|uniref:ABC transporter ATP-binding protein n=1 Tax=Jiangella asiatica TaxID=2530372 RepID=A0A4R5DHF8_9ACTN|nr:ABC transporter ATP-binding protein [Jiangella asiatica]TDE09923.1 ABC transporter ATP-binding protein [Jiangella asiatica]
MTGDQNVLRVRDLRVHYGTGRGDIIAVNGVSFDVRAGETLGLVGESGSGKSTTAMALLRLVSPPGRIVGGTVMLHGEDLLAADERTLRRRRWSEVSLIPQGSMNSLNPVLRVGDQIVDVIRTHEGRARGAALTERVTGLLETVGLPPRVMRLYPHELSGGMKQRACIAMAIALSPSLIIADEPTSALDVVVQRVVARTLMEVKDRLNSSMILIGHDMALQAHLVDRIAVMYAGNIVEIGPVAEIFRDPRHPYTRHLIASVPSIHRRKPIVPSELRFPDHGRGTLLSRGRQMSSRRRPVDLYEVSPGHFAARADDETWAVTEEDPTHA